MNDQGLKWRRPRDGPYLCELPHNPDPASWPVQLGQDVVSEIILKHLLKLNAEVNFNHTLESLEQRENGTVVTKYSGGREHTSHYVVGADGGKSTVRKLVGIRLEGFTWEDFQMLALNVTYDLGSFGWGPGNAVVGDDIWAIVANIGKGNLWRVAFGVPTSELNAEEPYDQARELTRARVALNKLLPGPTDEAVIENISLYRLRQLCADTYVKNRVALAGDAAHVSTIPSEFNNLIAFVRKTNLLTSLLLQMTSPIGGLGLTTGLLDAALLARNLKKIILDSEPLSLLEIYGETRRDVYLNAAKPAAIFHTRLLTGTSEADVARRQEFIEAVNKRDFGYLKKNVGEAYGKLSSTRDEQ